MVLVKIATLSPEGELMYENEPFVIKVATVQQAIANKLRYGAKVTGPNQTTSIDAGGFMTVCDYQQLAEECEQ